MVSIYVYPYQIMLTRNMELTRNIGLFTNIISRVRQDGEGLVWSIKDDYPNLIKSKESLD